MATYSTRLALGTLDPAAGYVRAFTVPMGYRVVIRTIYCASTYVAGNLFILYLGPASGELIRTAVPSATQNFFIADTRVVLHEGENCYVRAIGATQVWSLHGYLLVGAGAPLVPVTLPAPP